MSELGFAGFEDFQKRVFNSQTLAVHPENLQVWEILIHTGVILLKLKYFV